MSNLYQRLCQTGGLPSPLSRRLTTPISDVSEDSRKTYSTKAPATGALLEDCRSKARNPTNCCVSCATVWTDGNDGSDSEAGGCIADVQPSFVDDDSQFSGSAEVCNGDDYSVRNDDTTPSDKSSDMSDFTDTIRDLRACAKTQLVSEPDLLMVSVDASLTAHSQDSQEFDACISPSLNLMDAMSIDVESFVTFDDETSLDYQTAKDDEAFQGEHWVAMNAKGRSSPTLSSSIHKKYNKYRSMQTPTLNYSTPKETRMRPWYTANESDFSYPANAVSSRKVESYLTEFNYLEMTKQVDEQIQVMRLGDRNDMKVLHQQLHQLKASTKSLSNPSGPSPRNSP